MYSMGGSALKLAITAQLVNRIELFLPDVSSVVLSTGGSDVLDLSNWGDGDVVPSTHRDDIPSLCVYVSSFISQLSTSLTHPAPLCAPPCLGTPASHQAR